MPDNTGQLFDVWPSTTTLWNLCDNHAPIQFDVLLFIPIHILYHKELADADLLTVKIN